MRNAVVTVPAYFDNNQIDATKKACEMAGLDCRKLLKEPTAAAIAYGIDKGTESLKRCLVFDFGGGTLDITILKLENRQIEVMAVTGDSNLGGVDIDNLLVQHCIEEFKRDDEDGADLSQNQRAIARIRKACVEKKHELIQTEEIEISVEDIIDGKTLSVDISRAQFNELCSGVFERALRPVDKAIQDAKLLKT